MDAEEDCDNETDNDDFWEELDSAKRAAVKKASANPGKNLKNTFAFLKIKNTLSHNRRYGT